MQWGRSVCKMSATAMCLWSAVAKMGFKERCGRAQRGGLAGIEILMCGCRRKEKSFARTVVFLDG